MKNMVFLFASASPALERLIESQGGIISHDPNSFFEIVIFPPGDDVSPFLYGQKKFYKTKPNFIRDMRENTLYRKLPRSVPKIGVGRGAQFLNVMAGGSLHQSVSNHLSQHLICDFVDDNEMMVTSCHKQMMILPDKAHMLAGARVADKLEGPGYVQNNPLSKWAAATAWPDVEVGFVDETASLLFQPRPEMAEPVGAAKNTKIYFLQLIDDWVLPLVKSHPIKVA